MVPSKTRLNGHDRGGDRPDRLLGFTVPGRHARGRIIRIGGTLDLILSAHDYPEPLARLLAEALVLTALIGATLRPDEGQMTLQAQTQGGPVDLLVCDYRGGALRGYLRITDPERAACLGPEAMLPDIFGAGYLAITLDQTASAERYQGIVPLEGDTLTHAAERYFAGSEQIPTLVRVGVEATPHGWVAGGLLVQHLPRGEEGGPRLFVQDAHPDWQHIRALADTIQEAELTDAALPLETLLWRLFHEEEIRVTPAVDLQRGCRCSPEHIRNVLSRFSTDDLAEMRQDDGLVKVDCAFCAQSFHVDP